MSEKVQQKVINPVKKKGNGNKKTGKSKVKGNKKKRVPIQMFASMPVGYGAIETDEVDATVLYSKSVTGAVEVKIRDIALRGGVTMSYDIGLLLPGYGNLVNGVVCNLLGSTYVLTNPSPFTLTVRLQRPMGYADDCASLAMWEPLGGVLVHELRPRATLKLGSSNGSTDHMVPREFTYKGERAVHVLSFAVYREPLTDFGTEPKNTSEIGLIMEMVCRYQCVNGEQGQQTGYVVESYNGANRMNHISQGPLVPLRFRDINVPEGPVNIVGIDFVDSVKSKRLKMVFANKAGVTSDKNDLDVKTVYRFDTGLLMINPITKKLGYANYVAFVNVWTLGFMNSGGTDGSEMFFTPGDYDDKYDKPLSKCVDEWLYPVSELTSKSTVKCRKIKGVLGIQSHTEKFKTLADYKGKDDSIVSKLVKALVVVYDVSKLAVEILGVVGVLENPELKKRECLNEIEI